MKVDIEPLFPHRYYHIYNRGINGETLFKQERNYPYFLKKYALFIPSVANTLAYCLLGNHFHLLVRTKKEEEILTSREVDPDYERKTSLETKSSLEQSSWLISNAFSSLFKSYSQSLNKEFKRTGALFERPFRRKEVANVHYLAQVMYYIHANPQKHGFCADFRDYPHSSYHAHVSPKPTRLAREEALASFGGTREYLDFHRQSHTLNDIRELMIEFD